MAMEVEAVEPVFESTPAGICICLSGRLWVADKGVRTPDDEEEVEEAIEVENVKSGVGGAEWKMFSWAKRTCLRCLTGMILVWCGSRKKGVEMREGDCVARIGGMNSYKCVKCKGPSYLYRRRVGQHLSCIATVLLPCRRMEIVAKTPFGTV